ncbi:GlxA family transcriptional regulator [Salipiger sp. PrR002]|uniref:GlxA family transcriptional regulator n=1 Tax=Salipiger sp. PrR002 TaxID=2706489 RepID=UPI0013B6D284|nr:GlxA family transcriptional regulator [Salipiger sp. PrR002]NDV99974.1 GlxA family transcriptional regulator [Salipiger sp. PrR002]NDW56233.1 GlxA family transcriptional regulator [Salipiger sp. PrR004]
MPPAPSRLQKRLRVAFLLADKFTLSAFANFVDVLRLAADEADHSRPILCDWTVLSDTLEPIRSSCGVRVQPETRLRSAESYDYLVVVGGLISDEAALNPAELAFLRRQAAAGVPIVGLCTGVFILHQLHLLDGYRCCVSWFHHQDFIDRFEAETPVSDQIFVVDRDRLTCSGGHGAAHLAAFLVQRHIGQSAAIKSLNIMMIDDAMSGEKAQPGQALTRRASDELVKRAVLRMQQHLEMPKSIDELARDLGVGRRTLERRFLADLKQTPLKAYLELRLERALNRLRTTDASVTEVALACGFCDGPHLSRTLKSERGVTPAEYRKAQSGGAEDQMAVGVLLPGPD